jgi:hypothetical protein
MKHGGNICILGVNIASAIYNSKIVDTASKELPLIHMYMTSNLIFDCIRIGFKNTDTFV